MHRWDRDYNRAARPPNDIQAHAKETLVAWFLLLFFVIVLGFLVNLFGLNNHE